MPRLRRWTEAKRKRTGRSRKLDGLELFCMRLTRHVYPSTILNFPQKKSAAARGWFLFNHAVSMAALAPVQKG